MTTKLTIEERHKKADEKIAAAQADQGDLEIRDAMLEKAELFHEVKDYENYRVWIKNALGKSVGNSKKLELTIMILNTYWVERNFEQFEKSLDECRKLTDDSLDWEKKNKLAIYNGIHQILKRQMTEAAKSLIACIDTFNSPEIMTFKELVKYAVILGLLELPRKDLREKLVQNAEINSVLNETPLLKKFLQTIYGMQYKQFFSVLIELNDQVLIQDVLLSRHRQFLLKRARIVIYSLFLESYKTVKLDKMAQSFGVSVEFLDQELADLISQKYINCKIDKVNLVVQAVKVDDRSTAFQEIERKGDALVERLHKLMKRAQA